MQAIRATRPGGHVGYVGVAHGVSLPGEELFFSGVHLHGGPAPVRRFLPDLIDRIWNRQINPGRVFELTLPLEQAAAGVPGDGPTHRHQGPAHPLTMTRTTTPGPRRTTRARPPLAGFARRWCPAHCRVQSAGHPRRPGRFHQPGFGRRDPIGHPHSWDVSDPTHLQSRSTDGHPHLHSRRRVARHPRRHGHRPRLRCPAPADPHAERLRRRGEGRRPSPPPAKPGPVPRPPTPAGPGTSPTTPPGETSPCSTATGPTHQGSSASAASSPGPPRSWPTSTAR